MKSAIILFVCNAEPGKVKPTIASQIGQQAAVDVYKKLLLHTKTITQSIAANVYVFCAENNTINDLWNEPPFVKLSRHGHDFSSCLTNAFSALFAKGYKKVVYMCTDCLEVSRDTLNNALDLLNTNHMVIGPKVHNGVYLLAANRFDTLLFANINWAAKPLQQLQQMAEKHQWVVTTLPAMNDVETADDCKKYPQLA